MNTVTATFSAIRDILPQQPLPLLIADLGCGTQTVARRLRNLGLTFEYCGVDNQAALRPNVLADLRSPTQLAARLPWQPEVITLVNVLEHFDGCEDDIRAVLRSCHELLRRQRGQLVVVTQSKWRAVIAEYFDLESVRPVGLFRTPWLGRLDYWFSRLAPSFAQRWSQGILLAARPRLLASASF